MNITGLIAVRGYDLHREKCANCGKILVVLVDDLFWRIPVRERNRKLCRRCRKKEQERKDVSIHEQSDS